MAESLHPDIAGKPRSATPRVHTLSGRFEGVETLDVLNVVGRVEDLSVQCVALDGNGVAAPASSPVVYVAAGGAGAVSEAGVPVVWDYIASPDGSPMGLHHLVQVYKLTLYSQGPVLYTVWVSADGTDLPD